MSDTIRINAEIREDVGKGASRRLRRDGKVPAVIYGAHKDPVALTLIQEELIHEAENEAFYASVLEIVVGDGRKQSVVVRDMQRHPYRAMIMHVDFLRVSEEDVLKISVPLHFIGEDDSPAGKAAGVVIQHLMTEVEIAALPKDLPEYIEVDLSDMDAGDAVMLSELKLPEGVELPALAVEDEDHDTAVANAIHIKADQGTGAAAAAEAEAAAADELGEAGAPAAEEEAPAEGDEEESEG